MAKKGLLVVTNIEKHRVNTMDKATGFWFSEVSHIYIPLAKAGWQLDIVSPQGGYCPVEPASLQGQYMNAQDWKLYGDKEFRSKISNSLKPGEVDPTKYDLIYYAGGHGTVYDFYECGQIHQIAAKIYEKGGVVSAICHGPVGLINIKLSNGEYLIKDKKLTAFSNVEEIATTLDKHVPYSLEDELVKRGCKYEKGEPWSDYTVQDQRLITGQNPSSGHSLAKLLLEHKWE